MFLFAAGVGIAFVPTDFAKIYDDWTEYKYKNQNK